MASTGLMSQSLELMLLGMGTVFVFLTLLVFCTNLMSRILIRIAPEIPQVATGRQAPAIGQSASDERLRAVIVAAIHAHRAKQ